MQITKKEIWPVEDWFYAQQPLLCYMVAVHLQTPASTTTKSEHPFPQAFLSLELPDICVAIAPLQKLFRPHKNIRNKHTS